MGAGLRIARKTFRIADVDRSEVLRYLGYHGQVLSNELGDRIDDTVAHCLAVARPRATLASFAVRAVTDDAVELEACTLRLTGHDIAAFIDAQTDITDDMRDYLQTLHRMTDLAKDARGDAADALESAIYDIRSSICSLAKWLVDRINNKVDDMRGALWDDLQTKEGFIEDATANVWRFTADGDRWDR